MGLFNKIYEGKYTNSFENSIDIAYKTFAIISYVNWEHISGFVDLQPILLTNAIPPTDHLFNIFFFFWGGGRVRGPLLRHVYYTGKGQCHKICIPIFLFR